MGEAPKTDWDMMHRWEWFRREEWRRSFRTELLGANGGVCKAFHDLARLVHAEVALDCACGLGRQTVCLAEMGLNVIGSDISHIAVNHARELARLENCSTTFFVSSWGQIPKNMPHHFDAIINTSLAEEPEWDSLGSSLIGMYHALNPGGFLMFTGVPENSPEDEGVRRLFDRWGSGQKESIDWFHREGRLACAKLVQRELATDFLDERNLYIIDDNGSSRLESTMLRRPGYWTWNHWRDLARMAGFCHLETRTYDNLGENGEALTVNVAWKSKDGGVNPDETKRAQPYLD
jgi:SAM-dependent methyltransferase